MQLLSEASRFPEMLPTKRQAQGRVVKSLLAPRRQRLLLQVLENKM
jgi:hypothetical protein